MIGGLTTYVGNLAGINAAANTGASSLSSVLGAAPGVANALGGMAGLAGTLTSLIYGGRQSQQQHMAQRQWERLREPVGEFYKQTFYNPVMEGYLTPYGAWTPQESYAWAPSESLQRLYQTYLNRSWGMPESVAQARVSQAFQPTQTPRIPETVTSPAAVGSYLGGQTYQSPEVLAQAMLGSRLPDIERNLDYLRGAAELAAFNLQRAQLLPQLIG